MGLLFWKDNKKVDELAMKIAGRIASALPAEKIDARQGTRKNLRKFEREINKAVEQLEKFNLTHKFGIYSRARFHRTFMDQLTAYGYDEELVKALNDKLLYHQF